MCTAAAAIAGGSLAVSAYGGMQEAKAQKTQAKAYLLQGKAEELNATATAAALEFNARMRDLEAAQTEELGAFELAEIRERNRLALSQQVVDFAAAGRDPTSGTSVAVAYQSAAAGEKDALKSRTSTVLQTQALRAESALLRTQAGDALRSGKMAVQGSRLQAKGARQAAKGAMLGTAAKILTGASQIAALG